MVDAVCYDDLDRYGAEMDDPVAELEQDVYHRLIEPPGSNIDDIDRGLGLPMLMSKGVSTAFLQSIPGRVNRELAKDDRIDRAETAITDMGGGVYRLEIAIFPQGKLVIQADTQANQVTRVT